MDFNKYYLDQTSGSNYPVFRGVAFQRGYGLGNFFQRFFSWVIPHLKQHALPIAKEIGKEVVSNVANIANDAIEGRDIKESAKRNIKTSLEKLQKGKGIKRKRINNQNSKKFRDIFS